MRSVIVFVVSTAVVAMLGCSNAPGIHPVKPPASLPTPSPTSEVAPHAPDPIAEVSPDLSPAPVTDVDAGCTGGERDNSYYGCEHSHESDAGK